MAHTSASDLQRLTATRLTESVVHHGEGPCWSLEHWGGLRWVDMLSGDYLSLPADVLAPLENETAATAGSRPVVDIAAVSDHIIRTHVAGVCCVVRPRVNGGAVIAADRGFVTEDPDGALRWLAEAWTDTSIRMNEGGIDGRGRFLAGGMAYDKRDGATGVFRLDPVDGTVETVLTGATIANGLDLSPDGRTAYWNDTPTGQVAAFDVDENGDLVADSRRVFVDLRAGSDLGTETLEMRLNPDGLTVDSAGNVWVACNGSGSVRRFTPDGTQDVVVEVGARQTTACTLAGSDLRTLVITTSRENLAEDEDPTAGSLYAVRVDVPGLPVREFAG
jgi:sugar lactone lactonase YvrE